MRIDGNLIPPNVLRLMSETDRRALGKAGRTRSEIQATNDRKLEKKSNYSGRIGLIRG